MTWRSSSIRTPAAVDVPGGRQRDFSAWNWSSGCANYGIDTDCVYDARQDTARHARVGRSRWPSLPRCATVQAGHAPLRGAWWKPSGRTPLGPTRCKGARRSEIALVLLRFSRSGGCENRYSGQHERRRFRQKTGPASS